VWVIEERVGRRLWGGGARDVENYTVSHKAYVAHFGAVAIDDRLQLIGGIVWGLIAVGSTEVEGNRPLPLICAKRNYSSWSLEFIDLEIGAEKHVLIVEFGDHRFDDQPKFFLGQ